jgi:hypothetical protein
VDGETCEFGAAAPKLIARSGILCELRRVRVGKLSAYKRCVDAVRWRGLCTVGEMSEDFSSVLWGVHMDQHVDRLAVQAIEDS